MDESIRPRRPGEKVEEDKAMLVQRILVSPPPALGGLRTQPESDGRCKDSCPETIIKCRREYGTPSGDCMGSTGDSDDTLSLLDNFIRVKWMTKKQLSEMFPEIKTGE